MKETKHVRDQLVAYLSGNLDEKSTAHVAGHLGGCESCGRELESLRRVWLSLGKVPDEVPHTDLQARFDRTLGALVDPDGAPSPAVETGSAGKTGRRAAPVRTGPKTGWLDWISPRHPAVQFALVLVLFVVGGVVGGLLGYRMGTGSVDTAGMVQLREEVRSVNRLLIVSLLQQQSATERLQGVSWSYRVDQADPEVTRALLQTLDQDANVNVRLAALDAVSGSVDQPAVREGLLRSLTDNSSPMVQLAILDVVVHTDMKESAPALKSLLENPAVNKDVKARVEQALEYLNI